MEVRRAKIEDAAPIQAIFSHYVLHSVATYYYDPPPIDLFTSKIERSLTNKRFPFVPAENDKIVEHVYGTEYRVLAGYHCTVEDNIFIQPEYQKMGLGKQLLGVLIDERKRLEYPVMTAIFGAGRDVLRGTFKLDEGYGFREVGRLIGVGEKFGHFLDTPILQQDLTSMNSERTIETN